MSKKPDFTFAEVGLSKGDILKPHFKKGMPVEWHGKEVREVIVKDATHVYCNGEPEEFSTLTKAIMDSQDYEIHRDVQSSSRWTWEGKLLSALHDTVHASYRLITLLNDDFNQALPMYDTAPYNAQPKMLALAVCFGVTSAMFAESPKPDMTKAGFFVDHILNLILEEVQFLMAHEDPAVFKLVFDEYSQALKNSDIDCTRPA